MNVREWVQYLRLNIPEQLAVRVHPEQSFPVWIRPIDSDERVAFEVAFTGDEEPQVWDIGMVESVIEDAHRNGDIDTVPVQDSPFSTNNAIKSA